MHTKYILIFFIFVSFPTFSEPPKQPTRETEYVVVKTSFIPHAGEGVFAKKKIPKGMLIGYYLGKYLTMEEARDLYKKNEHHYFFGTPECAQKSETPYIDGNREHYTSKVNFAPSKINGKELHLINVYFKKFCKEPFVRLFASRDIQEGEELYVSYGSEYEYFFMKDPEVRKFFLEKAGIELDNLENFEFEP